MHVTKRPLHRFLPYTIVNKHNVPSTASVISSQQYVLCYATSQEKSETNTVKLDER